MSNHVIVCRKAADKLIPGYLTGHPCSQCGAELQISPIAQAVIRRGHGKLYCNPCGLRISEERKGEFSGVILSPQTRQQIRQWQQEESSKN